MFPVSSPSHPPRLPCSPVSSPGVSNGHCEVCLEKHPTSIKLCRDEHWYGTDVDAKKKKMCLALAHSHDFLVNTEKRSRPGLTHAWHLLFCLLWCFWLRESQERRAKWFATSDKSWLKDRVFIGSSTVVSVGSTCTDSASHDSETIPEI